LLEPEMQHMEYDGTRYLGLIARCVTRRGDVA
jgi:hypothetical protein